MIGVFDSGVGGLSAVNEIRAIAPLVNICFLADKKNAPYGNKSLEEIIEISKRNIKILLSHGVEKILIACCTASTAFPYFTEEEKQVCVPIIELAAKRAFEISDSKRIGVIATERTVAERAFTREIQKFSPGANVYEIPTQNFVAMVESGVRDYNITAQNINQIKEELLPLCDKNIDSLILGCTHFPHIGKTIKDILKVKTVNPALEGALKISNEANLLEDGKTMYL